MEEFYTLMKAFIKIDRFYLYLGLVLLFLAVLGFFTFRGIFLAFKTSREIDEELIKSEMQINQELLNKAYEAVADKLK